MTNITINGKEYNVKYSIRALMLFEQITDKNFEISSIMDKHIFYYCLLLASNKDCSLDWDEFIDALDENPQMYKEIEKVLEDYNKSQNKFPTEKTDEDGKKKSISVSELVAFLVLSLGLNPNYVLDEMQSYECKVYLDFSYFKRKEIMELGRNVAWCSIAPFSKKKIKPHELWQYPWEDKDGNPKKKVKKDTSVSKEEIKKMTEQAKRMEELYSQGLI